LRNFAPASSNSAIFSLFLFIRDLADGDLIGWMDAQLEAANSPAGPDRLTRMAAALIEPMREMYGVSDKVLAMALSVLLLGAPKKMVRWIEVGGSMIAIDTLVHNFLHRTGILARFNANHLSGAACYRRGGCTDIIQAVANRMFVRLDRMAWYVHFLARAQVRLLSAIRIAALSLVVVKIPVRYFFDAIRCALKLPQPPFDGEGWCG
jgi:hypothetical protein